MHVYRFRLLNDENDDFLREIEIGSNQTFIDFHEVIRKTTGFNGNELASFFVCDIKWQKLQEITLIDMESGYNDSDQDEEIEDSSSNDTSIAIMDRSVLKNFITEPQQRLLYEYDILNQGAIYIELISILKFESDKKYPAITKSVGSLFDQKRMNEDNFTPPEVDQNELLKEFEELLKGEMDGDDFEPYFDD
jgi:hypothetical protein